MTTTLLPSPRLSDWHAILCPLKKELTFTLYIIESYTQSGKHELRLAVKRRTSLVIHSVWHIQGVHFASAHFSSTTLSKHSSFYRISSAHLPRQFTSTSCPTRTIARSKWKPNPTSMTPIPTNPPVKNPASHPRRQIYLRYKIRVKSKSSYK